MFFWCIFASNFHLNFFSSKKALFFVPKTYVFSNFRFKPLSNFLPYNNARTHSYVLKELREAMQGIYIIYKY